MGYITGFTLPEITDIATIARHFNMKMIVITDEAPCQPLQMACPVSFVSDTYAFLGHGSGIPILWVGVTSWEATLGAAAHANAIYDGWIVVVLLVDSSMQNLRISASYFV